MTEQNKARDWLHKHASRRPRSYPLATIAYYGPTDRRATKVVVGILPRGDEVTFMKKWFSEDQDARDNTDIREQIVEFLKKHRVEKVVVADRIIGCPHEEGIDYPDGGVCPQCPFWEGKDRWSGFNVN
jgi:hypothetical protein